MLFWKITFPEEKNLLILEGLEKLEYGRPIDRICSKASDFGWHGRALWALDLNICIIAYRPDFLGLQPSASTEEPFVTFT